MISPGGWRIVLVIVYILEDPKVVLLVSLFPYQQGHLHILRSLLPISYSISKEGKSWRDPVVAHTPCKWLLKSFCSLSVMPFVKWLRWSSAVLYVLRYNLKPDLCRKYICSYICVYESLHLCVCIHAHTQTHTYTIWRQPLNVILEI